jgi:glyoxylate/hydroxypyruvate reductase A
MMARAPALVLKSLGFKVSAWVRNPRAEGDVPIYHGPDQLELFLQQTDIAVCLLPLTRETEGIFCTRTFAMMPRGAMLVNVGRGKHVVDEDLINALDAGQLSYAALDALWPEPLPPTSPLWLHPKVDTGGEFRRRWGAKKSRVMTLACNNDSRQSRLRVFSIFLDSVTGKHSRIAPRNSSL